MTIKAECHSDDHVAEAEFDATPWFAQASDEAIKALAECGWGGDYPADAVAQFMAEHDAGVRRMFHYLEEFATGIGFECHVDEADALAWLAKNRPSAREGEAVALDEWDCLRRITEAT